MNIREQAIKARRDAEESARKISNTLTSGNLMQIREAIVKTLEAQRLQTEWLDAVETP